MPFAICHVVVVDLKWYFPPIGWCKTISNGLESAGFFRDFFSCMWAKTLPLDPLQCCTIFTAWEQCLKVEKVTMRPQYTTPGMPKSKFDWIYPISGFLSTREKHNTCFGIHDRIQYATCGMNLKEFSYWVASLWKWISMNGWEWLKNAYQGIWNEAWIRDLGEKWAKWQSRRRTNIFHHLALKGFAIS